MWQPHDVFLDGGKVEEIAEEIAERWNTIDPDGSIIAHPMAADEHLLSTIMCSLTALDPSRNCLVIRKSTVENAGYIDMFMNRYIKGSEMWFSDLPLLFSTIVVGFLKSCYIPADRTFVINLISACAVAIRLRENDTNVDYREWVQQVWADINNPDIDRDETLFLVINTVAADEFMDSENHVQWMLEQVRL